MLGTFGISAFLSSAVGVRVLNPLLGERALMMLSLFASMVQVCPWCPLECDVAPRTCARVQRLYVRGLYACTAVA